MPGFCINSSEPTNIECRSEFGRSGNFNTSPILLGVGPTVCIKIKIQKSNRHYFSTAPGPSHSDEIIGFTTNELYCAPDQLIYKSNLLVTTGTNTLLTYYPSNVSPYSAVQANNLRPGDRLIATESFETAYEAIVQQVSRGPNRQLFTYSIPWRDDKFIPGLQGVNYNTRNIIYCYVNGIPLRIHNSLENKL